MLNTILFFLALSTGSANPCNIVRQPGLALARPDWAFITQDVGSCQSASRNVEALMLTVGINPFDAVERAETVLGLDL